MIPVGILGATGIVGQRYAQLLANHPLFTLTFLGGSSRSQGKTYAEATAGQCPPPFAPLLIEPVEASKQRCAVVFSCIGDQERARTLEEEYARSGSAVISHSSAHRRNPLVPLLIPEINADHLAILPQQPWPGQLIAKPNCSLQSYLLPLYALHQTYPITKAIVTTLQAVSGAGISGIGSMHMLDNLIPHIPGEEGKSEWEPRKILGTVGAEGIQLNDSIAFSAHCNRVPVLDGHLACVSVEFAHPPERDEILHAWANFPGLPLPSAPAHPIRYCPEPDRPQPRLDRDAAKGMAVSVGRLRPCPVLQWRFVGLSHNTIRGAAGGGLLNAELLIESEMWHGHR